MTVRFRFRALRLPRCVFVRGALALTLGAAAISGCDAFDESLLASNGDGGVSSSCEDGSRQPPERPTDPDGPDGPEVVFALKNVRLDQSGDAWREIGFNLDGICSTAPDPVVECVPPRFPAAQPDVDGNEGIDNVFGGRLFPLIDLVFPELKDIAVDSAERGLGAVVVRIRGWNGQDDDPRVEVAVAQTVDTVAGAEADVAAPDITFDEMFQARLDGGELAPAPAWDGHDWAWLRADGFFMRDLERARIEDTNAYIRDRTLVVRLPDRVDIVFSDGEVGVNVRITDGIAAGRISDDLRSMGPVHVAGRWSILDLLDTARTIGVCDETPQFDLLSTQLDTIADVRSVRGSGGEGVECDALSLGVTFEGVPVRIAGIVDHPPLPNQCEEMAEETPDPPDAGP